VVGPSTTWNGLGRWWRSSLAPNGTSLMVGQPFHLGLGSWNHVVPVGALCVVFCAVVLFGAGSGGWAHSTT
jgi:hypothetical protein